MTRYEHDIVGRLSELSIKPVEVMQRADNIGRLDCLRLKRNYQQSMFRFSIYDVKDGKTILCQVRMCKVK